MRQDQLRNAYDQFFNKSEEGKHFILAVNEIINQAHESAEHDATFARDYTQHAKGARQVLIHIQSVLTLAKKDKPM